MATSFLSYGSVRPRVSLLPPLSPVCGGEGSGVRGPAPLQKPHPLTPTPLPRRRGRGALRRAGSAAADYPDAGAEADDANHQQGERHEKHGGPEFAGVLGPENVPFVRLRLGG